MSNGTELPPQDFVNSYLTAALTSTHPIGATSRGPANSTGWSCSLAGDVEFQQRHQSGPAEQLHDTFLIDIEIQLDTIDIGTQYEGHHTVVTRWRVVHGAVAARNGQAHTSHHDEGVSQPKTCTSSGWVVRSGWMLVLQSFEKSHRCIGAFASPEHHRIVLFTNP